MADFSIEQALFYRPDGAAAQLWARSGGFADDWVAEASDIIRDFGQRPGNVACPAAVFAYPFHQQQVAVVQVADQAGPNGTGGLGYYFLVLSRQAYEAFLGNPFAVARQQPAAWDQRGELPTLSWPAVVAPPCSVLDVQRVLQRVKASALPEDVDPETVTLTEENAESPALLGGVQVLVDGGRVVFERPAPDTELLAGLWTLLPYSMRCTLWPASFAFGNALGFDAVVVPHVAGDDFVGYLHEEQAADYPPGHYELALQMAAETGDQTELDALLCRRSTSQTWRLGLFLLIFLGILVLLMRMLQTPPPPGPSPPSAEQARKAAAAAGSIAVGDPWTALSLLEYGNRLWLKREQTP